MSSPLHLIPQTQQSNQSDLSSTSSTLENLNLSTVIHTINDLQLSENSNTQPSNMFSKSIEEQPSNPNSNDLNNIFKTIFANPLSVNFSTHHSPFLKNINPVVLNSIPSFPHISTSKKSYLTFSGLENIDSNHYQTSLNFLCQLLPTITTTKDTYQIKYNLSREDGQKILEQTGFEIPFFPGEQQYTDFTLGKGNFGTVYIGYAQKQKCYVSVKITHGAPAEAELAIQQNLKGQPFLMTLLDSYIDSTTQEPTLYQVMPLAGLGNLNQLYPLLQTVDPHFREELLFWIAKGLLEGLSVMHQNSFIHLDIKPSNCVIDHRGQPWIIDFGCSQQTAKGQIDLTAASGDKEYFPPEWWLAFAKNSSKLCDGRKIDSWAAGLTLYQLATGCPAAFSYSALLDIVKNTPAEKISAKVMAYYNKELKEITELQSPDPYSHWGLIQHLLQLSPEKRPMISEARTHPWMLQMEKQTSSRLKDIQTYLCEFVQSSNREKRTQEEQKKEKISDTLKPSSYTTLSPQDLPHAHFGGYVQRFTLQTLLQKRLLELPTLKTSLTVCQGMGGVGKTQLAIYLLHQETIKEHFGLRLWFQGADRKEMLDTQHLFLARELKLVDEKASLKVAIDRLHGYLADYPKRFGRPWLAIYDNADDEALLNSYLPPQGGHALVTTRLAAWKDAIAIDVLTPLEAEELMAQLLPNPDLQKTALCQELGYLPLGIVQACAYMRQQKLSVSEYLDKLHQAPQVLEYDERLFGKKLPHSIIALWDTTLATLEKEYPEALKLLHAAAYLSPDAIPIEVLSKMAFPKILEVAHKYAFLQKGPTGSLMHRLTQQVLRLKEKEEQKITSLEIALKAINKTYDFDPKIPSQRACNRQLLSHGQALVGYAEKFSSLPKELEEPLVDALSWQGNLHQELGQPYASKTMHEKSIVLAKRVYGQEHPTVATFLSNLGGAWSDLGDASKAIEYYTKAYQIALKIWGEEHPSTKIIKKNLESKSLT